MTREEGERGPSHRRRPANPAPGVGGRRGGGDNAITITAPRSATVKTGTGRAETGPAGPVAPETTVVGCREVADCDVCNSIGTDQELKQ